MLTTATLEKTLSLLDKDYTFRSRRRPGSRLRTQKPFTSLGSKGKPSSCSANCNLLEAAATGWGWDEGTTGDVLREILHVYPER